MSEVFFSLKEKLLQINSFKLKKYSFDTVHEHTKHDLAIYETEFDDLMNSYRQKRKKRTVKKSEPMIQNAAANSIDSRNRVNDNDDDRGNDQDMVLNNVSFLTPNPHRLCGTYDFKIERDIYEYHFAVTKQGWGFATLTAEFCKSFFMLHFFDLYRVETLESRNSFSSASVRFCGEKRLEDRDFIL